MGGGNSKSSEANISSSGGSLRRYDSFNSESDSVSIAVGRSDSNDNKPKNRHLFEREESDDESYSSSNGSGRDAEKNGLLMMSTEDEEMLKEVLSRFCYIESGLSTSTLDKVVAAMELESFPAGHCLLKAGEKGDKLYVVNDGELNVTINGRNVRTVRRKYVLGELAILYNEPRTATVVAVTNCSVWSLRRDVFKKIQSKASSVIPMKRARNLLNCPDLAVMPHSDLSKLASALRMHVFKDGEMLYSEGDLTNRCILIEEGNAEILFSEQSYQDVVKPLLETHNQAEGVPHHNASAIIDDLIGVFRPQRALATSESIMPPPISVSSRAVSGRASFSLMSTVPEDQESTAVFQGHPELTAGKMQLGAEGHPPATATDLRAYLMSKISWSGSSRLPSTKWLSGGHVGAGCVLGMPILRGKCHMPDNWKWYSREDLLLRGKDIAEGSKAPCTVIARGPVKGAIFTAERFEAMFGPLSMIASKSALDSSRTDTPTVLTSDKIQPHLKKFSASDFVFLGVLGKGAFGSVLLAECDDWEVVPEDSSSKVISGKALTVADDPTRSDRRQVAIKVMSKWEVVDLGFIRHICDERQIMAELSSMFVLKLYGTYQTPEMIALVTEALPSKDLWSLIYQKQKVDDSKGISLSSARFYGACMALAFSYIHEHGVAYRDVKPENIMIDEMGYVRIIDFGFAKRIPFTKVSLKGESKVHYKTFTLCGTPEYLAPEVVFNNGHDQMVDIWAMGITMYEMLLATTPFASSSPSSTFRKLAKVQRDGISFSKDAISHVTNSDFWSLLTDMLSPSPNERQTAIGGCTRGLVDYNFFESVDFVKLGNKQIIPEYRPPLDAVNHSSIEFVPTAREEKPCVMFDSKFADF